MKLKVVFKETYLSDYDDGEDDGYVAYLIDEKREHDWHGGSDFLFKPGCHLFSLEGEGKTKEEALNNLKANIGEIFSFVNNCTLQTVS